MSRDRLIRAIQNDEIKTVVLAAIDRGWAVKVTNSTHLRLTWPKTGRSTWSSTTRGKSSSGRNLAKKLQQIEREEAK